MPISLVDRLPHLTPFALVFPPVSVDEFAAPVVHTFQPLSLVPIAAWKRFALKALRVMPGLPEAEMDKGSSMSRGDDGLVCQRRAPAWDTLHGRHLRHGPSLRTSEVFPFPRLWVEYLALAVLHDRHASPCTLRLLPEVGRRIGGCLGL